MSEFDDYLIQKKIDGKSFHTHEQMKYKEFESLFLQMSPKSFTDQKLFLINAIRRKYPASDVPEMPKSASKMKVKPKLTPRIKK